MYEHTHHWVLQAELCLFNPVIPVDVQTTNPSEYDLFTEEPSLGEVITVGTDQYA